MWEVSRRRGGVACVGAGGDGVGWAGGVRAHTVVQTPQVAAHSRFMCPGLIRHWSSIAQMAQAVTLTSAQARPSSDLHTAHEVGQWASVCPGFSVHWFEAAQPGQSLCLSLHAPAHTPHLAVHWDMRVKGRCEAHRAGSRGCNASRVRMAAAGWAFAHETAQCLFI